MKELKLLLKKFFGYTEFRPMQEEVIRHILQKKDALVLMPTGGGKSLCYQLPAIYLPGTALVVSPLIALMKDQVESLVNNGVPAAALNSLMPEEEKQQIKRLCMQGKIKLLYISPEGLMSELDWLIPRMEISLIAVDEAHCVSHWGHDFRPEYTQLSILKERFPDIAIVALTATADKITRQDIAEQLNLQPRIFISSFDRPNLTLMVRRGLGKKEKISHIVRFIRNHHRQSGIIYCMRRADTAELVSSLAAYGIHATAYHAGLTALQREQAQDDFINDRVDVVCATIAFGMGIDKSNVRWVIHYNMPGSIENYYQEIGRAGRDGLKSDTLLLYSASDLILLRRFAQESGRDQVNIEKLKRMQRYCETDLCRRRVLLNYFGEETATDCGRCDVCLNPPERFAGTVLSQKALSAVVRTDEKVGVGMLIDILRASVREELISRGYDKLKTYGAGRDLAYREWKEYIHQMIQMGYLEIDYMAQWTLKVTTLGKKVLFENEPVYLVAYHEPEKISPETGKNKKHKAKPIFPLAAATIEETLFDALKQLRTQISQREMVAPYIIFSDDSLKEMSEKKPVTPEAFSMIRGVGEVKYKKYSTVFISLIRFVLKEWK